jgi:lipid-A-disaccharide synthase
MIMRLPVFRWYIWQIVRAAQALRPDAMVIIDSPDFTHIIAHKFRKRCPEIPIVAYVSPSVWAWRPSRARVMRAYVDHVMALLPFEPAAHQRLGGPPCTYVGHPLIQRVGVLRPDAEEARRRLSDPPVVLVLPGSRAGEIRRLSAVFGQAIELVRARYGELDLVLPTVPHLVERVRESTAAWLRQPRIVVDPQEKEAVFRVARAALAKSGTVTLELALAGVPMVTAYKVSLLDEIIFRLFVNVSSAILPNLVLQENVVPEIMQRECTPESLANALVPLLSDTPERRRQIEAFARLEAAMEVGTVDPSRRAADIVLRYATQPRRAVTTD